MIALGEPFLQVIDGVGAIFHHIDLSFDSGLRQRVFRQRHSVWVIIYN